MSKPLVVTLCTGNAARSPMAEAMLAASGAPIAVLSAGTHAVENQPPSIRTRDALASLGLAAPRHRSSQLTAEQVEGADLVIAMAAEHVSYVRRRLPGAADRTATLVWLVDHLPAGPESLAARVRSMDLAEIDLEVQGDVPDPAGGDLDTYLTCAQTLMSLIKRLSTRL